MLCAFDVLSCVMLTCVMLCVFGVLYCDMLNCVMSCVFVVLSCVMLNCVVLWELFDCCGENNARAEEPEAGSESAAIEMKWFSQFSRGLNVEQHLNTDLCWICFV